MFISPFKRSKKKLLRWSSGRERKERHQHADAWIFRGANLKTYPLESWKTCHFRSWKIDSIEAESTCCEEVIDIRRNSFLYLESSLVNDCRACSHLMALLVITYKLILYPRSSAFGRASLSNFSWSSQSGHTSRCSSFLLDPWNMNWSSRVIIEQKHVN